MAEHPRGVETNVCPCAQNNDWACPEELLLRAELTAQTGSELAGLTCRRAAAAPGAPATLAVADVAALVRVDPSAPGGPGGDEDPPVAAQSVPENRPGGILEGGQTLAQALALSLDQNLAPTQSPALDPGAPVAPRPSPAPHPTLEHPRSPAPSLAHTPVAFGPDPAAPLARALSERDAQYPKPRPPKAGHAGHWLPRAGAAGEREANAAMESLRVGHADPAARVLLPDGQLDDEWGDYDIDSEPYGGSAHIQPYGLEAYPEDKNPGPLDARGHKALDEARAQAEQALARAAESDGSVTGGGAFGTSSSAGSPGSRSPDLDWVEGERARRQGGGSRAGARAGHAVAAGGFEVDAEAGGAFRTSSAAGTPGGRNPDLDWVEGATAPRRQGSNPNPDPGTSPKPAKAGHAGAGLHLPGGPPGAEEPAQQHASGREQPEHADAAPDGAAPPPASHAGWGIHMAREEDVLRDPDPNPEPQAPPPVSHAGWGIHMARDEDVQRDPDPNAKPEPQAPPVVSHAGWAIHRPRDEDIKPDPEPSSSPEKQQAGQGEVDIMAQPGQGGAPDLAPLPPSGTGMHLTKELPAGTPIRVNYQENRQCCPFRLL